MSAPSEPDQFIPHRNRRDLRKQAEPGRQHPAGSHKSFGETTNLNGSMSERQLAASARRIEIATPTNASAELAIRLCFLASRKCGPRCSFVRSDLSLERPTTACPRLHSVVAVLRRVGRQHEYH